MYQENPKALSSSQQESIELNNKFNNEMLQNEENYKLDATVQSEYDTNLKINDLSIDSSRDYIKRIYEPNDMSKDQILDDISLDKSNLKQNKSNEILKRSEIQLLQCKREEALNEPVLFLLDLTRFSFDFIRCISMFSLLEQVL